MCIESAGIRYHPKCGISHTLILKTKRGAGLPEGGAIRCDPGNRHDSRAPRFNVVDQRGPALPQLNCTQFGSSGSRSPHQIADAYPPLDEMPSIFVRKTGRPVDLALDQARPKEGRIEAIAGMREMGLRGCGPQTRIDPNKQQLQTRTDQIGNRLIPETFELCSAKPHYKTG